MDVSPVQYSLGARACGHKDLNQFNQNDITTWKKEMAELTGIQYAGLGWKNK
jgi:hypothetical protein